MLYFNFTRIFKARGIEKPFTYLIKLGYSDNYATKIANNRYRKLSLDEVEKLCELFQCTPNDLLDWVPSSGQHNNDNHPLSSLKKKDTFFNLGKALSKVPLDKLADIENMIIREVEKKE